MITLTNQMPLSLTLVLAVILPRLSTGFRFMLVPMYLVRFGEFHARPRDCVT